jgi:hypothetical protein
MSSKSITSDQRGATPLAAIAAIVAVAVTFALLLSAAAPAAAADVSSTSMSADADKYKVAPGETVTILISNMPDTSGIAKVNFDDADGFAADANFRVTSVEKGLNATIKIAADAKTPLGLYSVEIVPAGNASHAITVELSVQPSVMQTISGNVLYIGTGIGLIVVAMFLRTSVKNKKAKRVIKPLSALLFLGAAAAILWVIAQLVGVML